MKATNNPESPIGDRGNWPETRPGGEQERMYPQTSEPPKGEPSPFRAGRRSDVNKTILMASRVLLNYNIHKPGIRIIAFKGRAR